MNHPDNLMLLISLKLKHIKNRKHRHNQFDELTTSSSEASFDDLQKDYTPVKQEPAVEIEPLEFNFSFEQTSATENTNQPAQQPELSSTQKQMSWPI